MKRFSRALSKLTLLGSIALTPMLANADYYADLVEVDGEWQISNISKDKENHYNRVNLASSSLVSHRYSHECLRGLFGLAGAYDWDVSTDGRACVPYNFEESNLRYEHIIGAPVIWMFAAGVAPVAAVVSVLALEPGMLFKTILPMPVRMEYDSEEFEEALEEGYSTSGGKDYHKKVFNAVDELYKQANDNQIEDPKSVTTDSYVVSYNSKVSSQKTQVSRESSELLRKFNLKNKSGYLTEIDSVSGAWTFTHKQDAPTVVFKEFNYVPLYTNLGESLEKVLFPAKNIDELEQRLTNASTQLNKWIESNRVSKERYLQHRESVRSDNKELMNQSFETLKRFNYQLSISSNGSLERKLRNQGVQFEFEYPKSASGKVGALKLDGVKPKLTILSKNFENLYPQDDLVINNSDIRVSLNNGYITIKNKTKSYVTLDALSLYHNSDVLTLGGNNFENYHEVAPEAETRLSLTAFNLRSLRNNYYAMTKAKAKKIKVSFGLAGKYRVTGRSERKSFYKKKDYRLDKLIARYRNEPIRL
jgi:hypothetical protein